MNLSYNPLFFVFHDSWKFNTYTETLHDWRKSSNNHRGHCHFFMMGVNPWDTGDQQAYSGTQVYNFSVSDRWSPNVTGDPNTQDNIEFIGTPKWYFYVREFWRRVYIQKWDDSDNDRLTADVGKVGIKWDASSPEHTIGPFREEYSNSFFNLNSPRTLPIEYWHNEDRTVRDNLLNYDPGEQDHLKWINVGSRRNLGSEYMIPSNGFAGRQSNHAEEEDGPADEFNARRFGHADSQYIYPTLEYQYVEHLNWEREGDADGGDGWATTITIPYQKDGVTMSPFSTQGDVSPPGTYFNDFLDKNPDNMLRYIDENVVKPTDVLDAVATSDPSGHNVQWDPTEWEIPVGNLGSPTEFAVPAHMEEDGIWVEQCLGAIVRAKALVKFRDNFGEIHEVWVTDSQFLTTDNYSGSDSPDIT
jgi:hypothetical protein